MLWRIAGTTRQDNAKVIIRHDTSVANNGYTGLFDSAITDWSGKSSNVTMTRLLLHSGDLYDTYTVSTTGVNTQVLAESFIYVKNGNGTFSAAGVDQRWYKCVIVAYDNIFDQRAYSQAARRSTIVHEIGHTLKLAHPDLGQGTQRKNIPIPAGQKSVMHSSDYTDFGAQAYDISELKAKWGN